MWDDVADAVPIASHIDPSWVEYVETVVKFQGPRALRSGCEPLLAGCALNNVQGRRCEALASWLGVDLG